MLETLPIPFLGMETGSHVIEFEEEVNRSVNLSGSALLASVFVEGEMVAGWCEDKESGSKEE